MTLTDAMATVASKFGELVDGVAEDAGAAGVSHAACVDLFLVTHRELISDLLFALRLELAS